MVSDCGGERPEVLDLAASCRGAMRLAIIVYCLRFLSSWFPLEKKSSIVVVDSHINFIEHTGYRCPSLAGNVTRAHKRGMVVMPLGIIVLCLWGSALP